MPIICGWFDAEKLSRKDLRMHRPYSSRREKFGITILFTIWKRTVCFCSLFYIIFLYLWISTWHFVVYHFSSMKCMSTRLRLLSLFFNYLLILIALTFGPDCESVWNCFLDLCDTGDTSLNPTSFLSGSDEWSNGERIATHQCFVN